MVNIGSVLKGITDKVIPSKKTTQTPAPNLPSKSIIITDKTSYKQDPFSPTGYSDKYNNPVSVKPTPQQELVNKKPNKSSGGQSGRGGGSGVGTPSNNGGSTIPATTPTVQTPQSSGNVISRDYGNKLEPMKVSGSYATGWGLDIIKQDVKYFFTGEGYVKNPLEPYSYTGDLSSDLPTGRFKTGTISTSSPLGSTGYNPYISYGDIQSDIDIQNALTTSNIVYKYQKQVTDTTTPEQISNINVNLNKEIQKTNYKPSIVNWNERTGSNIVKLGDIGAGVAIASNPYTAGIASAYYLNKGDTTSGLLYATSAVATRGLSGYSKSGMLRNEIKELETQPWKFRSYSVNTGSKGLTTLSATRFNEDASIKQTLKIVEPSLIKQGNTFSITGVNNKGIGMVTTKGNVGGKTIKATQTFTTSGVSIDVLKANKFSMGFSFKSANPISKEVVVNGIPKYTKGGTPSMNFNIPNKAWMLKEEGSTQTWLAKTGSGDIGLAKTTFKESNVNDVKIFGGGGKKSSNEYFNNLYSNKEGSQIQKTIIKTKTRGGRGSRGGSVLDQIQTPSLRVTTSTSERLITGLKSSSAFNFQSQLRSNLNRSNLNTSQRRSGSFSVTSPVSRNRQGQIQIQSPILKINQVQKQGSVFGVGSSPSTPMVSFGIPTGFGLPVFKWPSSDSSVGKRGKGNNKALRIGGYSPSYTDMLFNIKGKQPKRVTGLEVRPITTGKLFKIKINSV